MKFPHPKCARALLLLVLWGAGNSNAAPPPLSSAQTAPPATTAATPVAWLAAHRNSWPRNVVLTKEGNFPLVIDGKVAGASRVPAGTTVPLVGIGENVADIVYGGRIVRVAIETTDLRQRAKLAMEQAAAAPAATAPPVVATPAPPPPAPTPAEPATESSPPSQTMAALPKKMLTLDHAVDIHVTGTGDPLVGGSVNFTSPDAWLFLDRIRPSAAVKLLGQLKVNGASASANGNVRVVAYGEGSVIIPHKPDYDAMTVYDGKSLSGASLPLKCFVKYDEGRLGPMKKSVASFRLKRGYMATIAQEKNGTGMSRNYVAQDHDLVVDELPAGLDQNVGFVRVFPWRWTSKKGMAGGIWPKFNVGWFYDWNIGQKSSPDVEYVPIRQKMDWPNLVKQDWKDRGATHLLGYNEPDHADQSNLTVDQALAGWPDLLATGLRLGSPAPSDGGLKWLYEFLDRADAAGLRVDFVAVHYYRAFPNPADPDGATRQFYNFLKGIHDRTHRPIWITEWNNGANWTKAPDPNSAQQKATIAKMVKMLDETPFVERYAIYNWVEEVRNIQKKNGSITPAGEAYRDETSPPAYLQAKP